MMTSDIATTTAKALLIDDYPPHRAISTTMLEECGFAVDVADSGESALELLAVAEQPYDVIIMDVQMQGMNSIETTQRIRALEREKGFHQPIVGVTAHALATDRERYLANGISEFMSKPIHVDVLAKKLQHVLGGH